MQANPGQFANADLQALYETLTQKGKTSLVDAFQVGAEIEELDIADLEKLLAQTDNARIKEVYQELLRGSRNHLRSFMRNLAQNGASYVPVHISQEDFDRIVNSAMERQNNP